MAMRVEHAYLEGILAEYGGRLFHGTEISDDDRVRMITTSQQLVTRWNHNGTITVSTVSGRVSSIRSTETGNTLTGYTVTMLAIISAHVLEPMWRNTELPTIQRPPLHLVPVHGEFVGKLTDIGLSLPAATQISSWLSSELHLRWFYGTDLNRNWFRANVINVLLGQASDPEDDAATVATKRDALEQLLEIMRSSPLESFDVQSVPDDLPGLIRSVYSELSPQQVDDISFILTAEARRGYQVTNSNLIDAVRSMAGIDTGTRGRRAPVDQMLASIERSELTQQEWERYHDLFETRVRGVLAKYTKRHGWCEQVNKAIQEMGLGDLKAPEREIVFKDSTSGYKVKVTVRSWDPSHDGPTKAKAVWEKMTAEQREAAVVERPTGPVLNWNAMRVEA